MENVTARKKYLLNRMNSIATDAQLGTILANLDKGLKAKTARINATAGLAVGTHNLDLTVPAGCVVLHAFLVRTAAFTSAGGAGTLALQLEAANDILNAVDADTIAAKAAGTCVLGTPSTAIVTTAERTLQAVVAVEDLTDGDYKVVLLYADLNVTEDPA